MKKIFLILSFALLLSSCELEPNEVKNLSEEEKYEILERGYISKGDIKKTDSTKELNETKNSDKEENSEKETEINAFSSKKEVMEKIKQEYKKSEEKALLEIKAEIEKIKEEEIIKIEASLNTYEGLRGDLREKYGNEELEKLDEYLLDLEKSEILKAKVQIKKLMDIEINKYK